jgi:hypothetical protein
MRLGRETSVHNFSYSGGSGAVFKKSTSGDVAPKLCFASGEICGSRSAFLWVRGVKHRCTIFHACMGPVQFPEKCMETRYTVAVFLLPVGSACHAVHFSASEVRNVSVLFFTLGWAWCGFHKKHAGTHYKKLRLLHQAGSAGHIVHSSASRAQNNIALFFML